MESGEEVLALEEKTYATGAFSDAGDQMAYVYTITVR